MKIELLLPRESEAKVTVSKDAGTISLEPYFSQATGVRSIGYLTVQGSGGKAKHYTLQVSGKSGRLVVVETKRVEAAFDKESGDDE